VAAMERMRDLPDMPPESRLHQYFRRRLIGYERDPFGVEISQLSLALADYPHRNGWRIRPKNVFTSRSFSKELGHARVVLCNPPFRAFDKDERQEYRVKIRPARRRTLGSRTQPPAPPGRARVRPTSQLP